jgi:hypothetical protein
MSLKKAIAAVLLEWAIALQPNFLSTPNASLSATDRAIAITTGEPNQHNVADPKITSSEMSAIANLSDNRLGAIAPHTI